MQDISLDIILNRISQADSAELSELTKAICRRYGIIHPDSEVAFLSIPKKDPRERKALRDWLMQHI